MKSVILFVLGLALVWFLILFVSETSIFGVAKSSDVIEAIEKNKNSIITCDEDDFLRIGKMPTIWKNSHTIFMKYYVSDEVGGVYFWTPAAHKIDSIYDKFKMTKRQKLGLDK